MIVKYVIQKHNKLGKYVVWRETKSEHGYGARGVFQGTRQEYREFLEELKKGE